MFPKLRVLSISCKDCIIRLLCISLTLYCTIGTCIVPCFPSSLCSLHSNSIYCGQNQFLHFSVSLSPLHLLTFLLSSTLEALIQSISLFISSCLLYVTSSDQSSCLSDRYKMDIVVVLICIIWYLVSLRSSLYCYVPFVFPFLFLLCICPFLKIEVY